MVHGHFARELNRDRPGSWAPLTTATRAWLGGCGGGREGPIPTGAASQDRPSVSRLLLLENAQQRHDRIHGSNRHPLLTPSRSSAPGLMPGREGESKKFMSAGNLVSAQCFRRRSKSLCSGTVE